MTGVTEIREAVTRLSSEELAAFRAWFEMFEAERFDRRIEQDVVSGRLDRLADDALADSRRGDVKGL